MNKLRKIFNSPMVVPYVLVSPFVLFFLLMFAYPMVSTIMMSFQNIKLGSTTFIGLKYYQNLLKSMTFQTAVLNTCLYTALALLIVIPIPMVIAAVLNSKHIHFTNFFRASLFIPALTSTVVAGIIFRLIFGEMDTALMNSVLGVFGTQPIKWLKNKATVYLVLELMSLWRWCGVNCVYFLSGMQSIPASLYESAALDGAGKFRCFWHITAPMLKNVIVYVLTISIYGGLAMFTESYTLFNGTTSPMNMGLTIVGYLYREGLGQGKLGLGSAIGVLLLLMTLGLNLIQLLLTGTFRKKEQG